MKATYFSYYLKLQAEATSQLQWQKIVATEIAMAALAHAIPGEGNDVILPYHGVVDYSFKELKAVVDLGNEMPRNSDVLGIEAKLKVV